MVSVAFSIYPNNHIINMVRDNDSDDLIIANSDIHCIDSKSISIDFRWSEVCFSHIGSEISITAIFRNDVIRFIFIESIWSFKGYHSISRNINSVVIFNTFTDNCNVDFFSSGFTIDGNL